MITHDSNHSEARALEVIERADAAGFELNDGAKWILHRIALHPDSCLHSDDDQAALFSRSLEFQVARVLEMPRPEHPLASGTDLMPENSLPEGATSYRYFLTDMQGDWGYIALGAGDEFGNASISGAEITGRLQGSGGGFSFTHEDLRNWSFANRGSLPQMKQSGTLRAKVELQDRSLAWGKESLELRGLLNYPGLTLLTAADNGAGSTDWLDKTIDQIVRDIRSLIQAVEDATNLLRTPTMILMSKRTMDYLHDTRIVDTTTGGTSTYWEYLMKVFVTGGSVPNGPELPRPETPIQFRWVRYMDGRNERSEVNGVPQLPVVDGNRTDSIFAYIHNNPDIVSKDVTPMTGGRFLPPQRRGLRIETVGEAKWGGIRCPEPVTLARMDGVFGNAE
jgi:hypothetical protein